MTTDPGRPLFIGWLDGCGSALATILAGWARHVFRGVPVSIGPDVRADRTWQSSLPEAVCGAGAALVCVIGEQAGSAWLHLQLGACLRALGGERPVVPVLLDVEPETLASTPLGLFQAVRPTDQDFRRLVRDLGHALIPGDEAHDAAVSRFESGWPDLLHELDGVPGSARQSFQIVLVLPRRVIPVPNSAPVEDEAWASVMRRMVAIQTLPGMDLKPFESSDLECLDLTREEWMRPPRLVSRLRTRNVALVHREVKARYHGEAKAIAKAAKLRLTGAGRPG